MLKYFCLVLSLSIFGGDFFTLPSFAADVSFDVFIEACRHCGENPNIIYSGYAEFDNEYTQEGSEELTSKIMGSSIAKIKDRHLPPDIEKQELETVKKLSRFFAGGTTKYRYRVFFTGNDLFFGLNDDCRRYRTTEQYNEEQKIWGLQHFTIFEGSPNAGGVSVTYMRGSRSVNVTSVLPVQCEFQRYGRIQTKSSAFNSLLLSLTHAERKKYHFSDENIRKFKEEIMKQKNLSIETTGTTTYDNTATATILEIKNGERVMERIWVDPLRGYICPLIQYFSEDGQSDEECISKNYFLHEKTGLWYPEYYEETGMRLPLGKTCNVYRLNKETFQLNQTISVKMFALDIPEGTKVYDKRNSNEEMNYIAVEAGVLSLEKGGFDLKKMKWLLREGDIYYNHVSKKNQYFRLFSIVIGLLLVISSIYMKIRNYLKRNK
jgi:hypothetical protein